MSEKQKDWKQAEKEIENTHSNSNRHPMTCGKDAKHPPLKTFLDTSRPNNFRMTLVCDACDWEQEVPEFIHQAR